MPSDFFEGFGDGIDDMPQRVSDHAVLGMGSSSLSLALGSIRVLSQ